jgi:hypothetical protein
MNVGDPTRKIPAFEEIYSRGTGRRGIQKTEYRRQKTEFRIPPLITCRLKFRRSAIGKFGKPPFPKFWHESEFHDS